MKNQKQPSLLIDRVKSATSSVELIVHNPKNPLDILYIPVRMSLLYAINGA
jgi:hypothetical protein